MKFTQIAADAFSKMQVNAGILLSAFEPETATITDGSILGATSGGIKASCVYTYKDMGDAIDNCPKNMMELKKVDTIECRLGGSFVTVDAALLKKMLGAADIDVTDPTKVTPRRDLKAEDFTDVWFVGDYSDKNEDADGGYLAIHLMNALNTAGFSMQTTDKDNAKFDVDFLGHFSMAAQDTVPMEFYIKAGGAA